MKKSAVILLILIALVSLTSTNAMAVSKIFSGIVQNEMIEIFTVPQGYKFKLGTVMFTNMGFGSSTLANILWWGPFNDPSGINVPLPELGTFSHNFTNVVLKPYTEIKVNNESSLRVYYFISGNLVKKR